MSERTVEECAILVAVLVKAMMRFKHLRLGQLLHNATGKDDLFYISDPELAASLQLYIDTHNKES
jgi:hypothetical protein